MPIVPRMISAMRRVRIPMRSHNDAAISRALEHSTLVRSLIDLTEAVSSAQSVDEMLPVLVEHAKSFTGTEKVVLCLFDPVHGFPLIDNETVVVRGQRSLHDESVWGVWLDEVVGAMESNPGPVVMQDETAGSWMLAIPLRVRDTPMGVLAAINSTSHSLRDDHIAYLSVLGSFATGALETARLAEEGRYSLIASERERIAAEMHDGIAQSLFGVSLGLESCKKLAVRDPAAVVTRLDDLQAQLAASMSELRRYIYDLRPAKLRDLGLPDAIRCWIKEITPASGPRASFEVRGQAGHLAGEVESCLYRVAREATTNAVRHSGATHLRIALEYRPDGVALVVEDDGCGFQVERAVGHAKAGGTNGLNNVRERVERVGGTLQLTSDQGRGTRLLAVVPLDGEGDAS